MVKYFFGKEFVLGFVEKSLSIPWLIVVTSGDRINPYVSRAKYIDIQTRFQSYKISPKLLSVSWAIMSSSNI